MTIWTHRTIIVPDAVVVPARMACEALAGSGGSGMYTVPLSPTGELPVTHWVSSGVIDQDFAALLPTKAYSPETDSWVTEQSNSSILEDLCTQAGVPYEVISQVLLLSDISTQSAEEALSRLGLKLVQSNEG